MTDVAPGFETLRSLCASVLRGEGAGSMLGSVVPEDLLALAERHRVVPLLAAGASAVPHEPLRRRMLALAQLTVRLERELAEIAACLSAARVEFLVLKGPAMARQAYPVSEWRAYDDLDLWVATRDLDAALAALAAAGYCRMPPLDARTAACARRAGIEAALAHPDRGRLIEMSHGDRALAPTARAAKEVRSGTVQLEVAGAWVRAPAPRHALLLACAHGAHHCWDRLGWVADVTGLWMRLSSADREETLAMASRWRMETILGLGLRLAVDHFGVQLNGPAAALANAARVRELAARVGLEQIGADSARAAMPERLRFERDALDSVFQRAQIMAGWIFHPTMGDIDAVPLPRALYPLYAVVRPLRLLRHPWWRDWRAFVARG